MFQCLVERLKSRRVRTLCGVTRIDKIETHVKRVERRWDCVAILLRDVLGARESPRCAG